ncbi:conserved hypothetical protein [Beutenbergia cavernae DSM 12333]|uniref:DinB-like domain-containing protein n=1 Tax=Beutenbergia cavernae (strain ATCC BAA-8 / DSM 12333 / CCUG 43141 / JCM 11478 / NBRC 16432 / NCIMB 13614 / HKI 0122) TaxID=471853 RepID=C5BZ17_BEUC1|nr:DinB family protein [Beutenbergia cavernae]ACQ81132.1 conserved hypothetical protein [Beutenbergia cavernae DSM 12333]
MDTQAAPGLDWTSVLLSQLEWHWDNQLRQRLDGLTDDEYLWKPVDDVWTVAPRGASDAPMTAGSGEYLIDFGYPEPVPAPVTTIAWRLGHLVVGVFGERNARYFGGPEMTYDSYDYPATADGALAALDEGYRTWRDGVASLDIDALAANCREPGFESDSMAALVVHIHREVIHHGAEIALLRDLYLRLG